MKSAPRTFGTRSVWMDQTTSRFPAIQRSQKTEVLIIGAGIAGLSAAYFLAKSGKKVIVVEKGSLGCGQTGRTTAHLSNAFDDFYSEMERLHGRSGALLLAKSHTEAINLMEKIVQEEKIDCDFKRLSGYWMAETKSEARRLAKEAKAARRAGLPVELGAELKVMKLTQTLHFPDQARFHPMEYLEGLAKACVRQGVKIYTESRVTEIEEGKIQKAIVNDCFQIQAETLVLATNSPINRNIIHDKQVPYRTYVVALQMKQGSVPDALLWDMKDPYHYVRWGDSEGRLLLVGGEDHRTGKANDMRERYRKLEAWAKERFPGLGKVAYAWSGQVMEPADGVAMIGKNVGSRATYIITGDSGNGMTHGTLGGKLIADLISKKKNPWRKIYDPKRLSPKAVPEYARDTVETSIQYKDWLTPGEEKSLKLKKGEGKVIRKGVKKLCVYRDEQGGYRKCSAVCTHLGCIVAWNSGEKSWDCPCHGSRFNPFGEVIEGPALGNLPEANQ